MRQVFDNANDCPQHLTPEQMRAEIVRRAYQAIRDEELEAMFL